MAKIVERLEWTSEAGAALFREVYDDGSRSALISAGVEMNDPDFQKKAQRIARERKGRKVD